MRRPLICFMAIAAGAVLASSPAAGTDLASYRWKNRLLLIFSPTKANPVFMAFDRSLTKQTAGVRDRDLIVLRIFEKDPSSTGQQQMPPADAEKLRARFRVATGGFTVILIGKDGGVKMVQKQRASLEEIFDLIDSMPMRQQEMRQKGKTP